MSHLIIGIHGLANKPPREIQHRGWLDAMREGLRRNCGIPEASIDFTSVYWADVLYPRPLNPDPEPYTKEPGKGPLKRYRDGWHTQLSAGALGFGGRAVDGLKVWFGMDKLADLILARKLADLHRYYTNRKLHDELQSRLLNALQQAAGNRIMLICHSMGSIIAYDVLRELGRVDPRFVVDHFVTIGSPLGLPHVFYRIRRENRLVRTPTIVRQWSNFADRRDPVAVDIHLADDFEPNDAGVGVRDDLVINGYRNPAGRPNHHKLYGYLRAPEVSEVIARFI